MASKNKNPVSQFGTQDFIKLFNSIALHKHRYEVFSDFVKMSAIALHNRVAMCETLETEYLQIIAKYKKDEAEQFHKLFGCFVELLDPEPIDMLGQLYMELELNSDHTAQFFTPSCVSQLLAKINYGSQLENLNGKAFITLSEPACGAGGMVLAFVKELISCGHNPAEKLWVQCIDIDRVASMMCYIQLSLWNVPAQVIVGNTLSGEYREFFYTPAHYLFGWDQKLRMRRFFEQVTKLENQTVEPSEPPTAVTVSSDAVPLQGGSEADQPNTKINTDTNTNQKKQKPTGGTQVDLFDFAINR